MAKRELGGGGTRERLVDSLARVVHLGTGAALALTPKLVIAISAHAVVMSDDPHEFDGLGQPPVGAPGLCLEIVNKSRASVRIDEVGLAGRYDEPWLAMAEPHLHDNKPWPRDLAPGEALISIPRYASTRLSATSAGRGPGQARMRSSTAAAMHCAPSSGLRVLFEQY